MKRQFPLFCISLWLGWVNACGQETHLLIVPEGETLRVTHETVPGKTYELQQSPDLNGWQAVAPAITGDGQPATHDLAVTTGGSRFFRLFITEAPVDLAPTEAEAIELFVDSTFEGYAFTSPTRFHWFGEGGEWSYVKTGPDSALMLFTYDEDGNNPGIYREEVVLTFTTPTSGSLRYSEFNFGVEDPGSVRTAPFSF